MHRAETRVLAVKAKKLLYPVGLRYLNSPQKRAFDLIGALALIPVAAAGIAGGAIAIKMDDGGPVFYVSEVVGRNGKLIRQYKLRTMRPDDGSPIDPRHRKEAYQHRVTRAGRFLRRWSIDELPQVWNILRGDMYLVGNRPVFEDRVNAWKEDEFLNRDALRWERVSRFAKFGCANVALLNGRSILDKTEIGTKRRIRLERYFLRHDSFLYDAKVLVRNAIGIFRKQGAE